MSSRLSKGKLQVSLKHKRDSDIITAAYYQSRKSISKDDHGEKAKSEVTVEEEVGDVLGIKHRSQNACLWVVTHVFCPCR